MADVQDLVDKKVAERVGRDGDIWWAVVNVDSSAKTLRLYDSVEGDLPIADVFNYLLDDQVQYVLFKVLGVDERGAVTSTRCKLILAQWIGPEVPRMKRMHASASKKAISEYFQGHHLSLDLFDRGSGLDEKEIEARLRAAGGAHQPSRMQFASGTKVDVICAAPEGSAAPARKASASEEAAPAAAAADAPAPTPAVAKPALTSPTKSTVSSVSTSSSSATPNVSRAKAEAQDAAAAVGKAATRLADLVAAHKDGAIPAAEVAAFIESLGGASTKLLGVVGLLS